MRSYENMNKSLRGNKREQVYNFIVDFMKKNGYSPTVREICVGTDLSSTSSVFNHLLALEDEGRIEVKPNSFRAIKVIGFEFVKMEESA